MLTERDAVGPDGKPDGVKLRRRISSYNASANKVLKALAREAGLRAPDEVSFHVARHSFADYARTQSGNVYAVSKALGHANLTITETYLRASTGTLPTSCKMICGEVPEKHRQNAGNAL